MEILNSHITIGNYEFDFVADIEIETSWEEQTAKGTITMPANLKLDANKLRSQIKRGDKVEIFIGYENAMYNIFNGYVVSLKPSTPVVIEVEDEMWKLKQIMVTDVCKNETLKSFLSRHLPGVDIDCFDISVPKFIANRISAAKLLDEIKSNFGLYSFFKGKTLVVGKQYNASNYNIQQAKFNYNIISDNLEFKNKDDIYLKVTAISNNEKGDKIEVPIGKEGGEERTLNFYNLPKAELYKLAKKEYDRLIYDGYRGDLTLFLEPFVRVGDVLELTKDDESDKTGRYWIDGVTYKFGTEGARQTVKIGSRT
jgi:hypothetical protein